MILPVQNAWAWVAVNESMEKAEAVSSYKHASDKKGCWVPQHEPNWPQGMVPRIVFLTSVSTEFILKERWTLWELQVEVKQLLANESNEINGTDCKVLQECLLVVSQLSRNN